MSDSYAPVDLDHRLVILDDSFFQLITNAVPGGAIYGGLDGIAALDHGPFLPEEEVGAFHGRIPDQAVADAECLAQRDSHFAIDPGEIIALRGDDTGTPPVARRQVIGGLADRRAAADGIGSRLGPGDPVFRVRVGEPGDDG